MPAGGGYRRAGIHMHDSICCFATMTDSKIERLIRPEIRALSAYGVDDAEGMVKLDAMENPFPWSEDMRAAWLEFLADANVNRYPDPSAKRLKTRLRETLALPGGRQLILGNGSDELIQIVTTTVSRVDGRVLTVTPSFVMYRRCAVAAGMGCDEIPLRDDDFSLDLDAVLRMMEQTPPAVVFLAYPNNPTGNLFDDEAMTAIAEAAPCPVIVDEAYEPFANRSWMDKAGRFDHVLVMRTLSKLGLAGLRLGYMLGPPAWVEQFEKIRLPYNINVLTQLSANFALDHYEVFRQQTALIREQRERLLRSMSELEGVQVWPSAANFLLFRTDAGAATIFDALRRRGVLIKNLDTGAPILKDCLRVTVGTTEENDRFLSALGAAIADRR